MSNKCTVIALKRSSDKKQQAIFFKWSSIIDVLFQNMIDKDVVSKYFCFVLPKKRKKTGRRQKPDWVCAGLEHSPHPVLAEKLDIGLPEMT